VSEPDDAPMSDAPTSEGEAKPDDAARAPRAVEPRTERSRPTVELDPRELANGAMTWPIVIAMLERIGTWATLAMRLGTITLLNAVLREMANETASAALVVQARVLLDALAHMPWDDEAGSDDKTGQPPSPSPNVRPER